MARLPLCLGGFKLLLAGGVQVAGYHESVRPVASDPGQIRPSRLRTFASGLGDGAGQGRRLFVERQAGVEAAAALQRIGQVTEA